jgi:hypothetical protein
LTNNVNDWKNQEDTMQMHVIATELGSDWAGPYTDQLLLQKTLAIIKRVDPGAETINKETDPFKDFILSGMLPFRIHVDIVAGEPQLPAAVLITWPPSEVEGIQEGTADFTEYFVWAKTERDALLRLARVNRAPPQKATEVAKV